jgi:hypothetical protein
MDKKKTDAKAVNKGAPAEKAKAPAAAPQKKK